MFDSGSIFIGVWIISLVVFYFTLKHLQDTINQVKEEFKHTQTEVNIDGIKDEVLDIIEEVLGNMHTPTAFDHIAGAVGQFVQYKLMRTMKMDEILDPQLTEGLNTAEI
jgi:hypothetical protein